MKTFVIDPDNSVKAYASGDAARRCGEGTRFSTERDFALSSRDWPMLRLVAIWNNLSGVKPVLKFTNRTTALRRIWAAIQGLVPEAATKTERVIGMISRPSGVSLKELMAATNWQAHSVRGFICAQTKKLGLQVESFKREGERVYRIRKRSL
jgi:hypothetical protein